MHATLAISLASLLLAAVLGAQRTFVVDAAGGKGSHFRDLQSAVASAAHGDLFLVRPGNYNAPTATISKGITIQATGAPVRLIGNFKIANVPANRSFVVKDFELRTTLLTVTGCAGPVLLDQLILSQPGSAFVAVKGCANVILRHCGLNTVDFSQSSVQVEGGTFLGLDQPTDTATIQSAGGVLEVSDARVEGGTVSFQPFGFNPSPAIRATSSQVLVRGGLANLIVKAGRLANRVTSTPVIVGDSNSRLILDTAVTLTQPVTTTPTVQGFGSVLKKALPTLRSSNRPVGGQNWQYSLHSRPGDPFVVAAGLPAAPVLFLGGYLHLTTTPMIVLQTGQHPTSGVSTFVLRLPSNPGYRAVPLSLQALAGVSPELSNGIALSVR